MKDKIRILIVDDDPKARQLLTIVFGKNGYDTVAAATGKEALERAGESAFDVALVDIMLPDFIGTDLLSPLTAVHPHMAVVMITAHASTETAVKALNEGASAYITKPLRIQDVLSKVAKIVDEQRIRREQCTMMEELRRYAAELETRNEALDAFAQTVAHDLKAPSYKISGYAEALLQDDEHGPLPQDVQQECLRIMAQGARQVSTLVDELLLLAQVRSEAVKAGPLAMGEIVAEARRRLDFTIQNSEARITEPDDWPVAWGYAPWVVEVWVNYISNALKYGGNPQHGLRPHVELGYGPSLAHPVERACGPLTGPVTAGDDAYVRFWVRDNGPGLTEEEQGRLFRPFTRLEQVGTKGHGLGLSVVRRIVEKLGGDVGVESARGEGSVFSFTLPRSNHESL